MIVKLQRPMDGSEGPVLIYDEARSFTLQHPMNQVLRRMFGTRYKFYAHAEMDANKLLEIGKKAPEQPW